MRTMQKSLLFDEFVINNIGIGKKKSHSFYQSSDRKLRWKAKV